MKTILRIEDEHCAGCTEVSLAVQQNNKGGLPHDHHNDACSGTRDVRPTHIASIQAQRAAHPTRAGIPGAFAATSLALTPVERCRSGTRDQRRG